LDTACSDGDPWLPLQGYVFDTPVEIDLYARIASGFDTEVHTSRRAGQVANIEASHPSG